MDVNLAFSIIAGMFGVGVMEIAYAEAEESAVTPSPPKDLSTHADMDEIAKKERHRIQLLIRNKGMKYGTCPRITVGVKGQKGEAGGHEGNSIDTDA